MAGIFKAYDIRGLVPSQLDEDTAYKIGLAYRVVLDDDDLALGGEIVVGRDMRASSEPLAAALIEGLRDSGLSVIDIGLASTPMNYFAIGTLEASGGIQVTASHNPAGYNGFKMSKRGARPVSGDGGIPSIEEKVLSGEIEKASERGGLRTANVFDGYADRGSSEARRNSWRFGACSIEEGSDVDVRDNVFIDGSADPC